MAKVDDRDLDVAGLYAHSMIELAEEHGQLDELLEELDGLAKYLDQNPAFEEFLSSPLIEDKDRSKVLEKAFRGKASDLLVDSLLVINRKGRLGYFQAIAEAYRREFRLRRGLVEARVRTAVPLGDALRAQLVEAITRFSGKRPILSETVDPSLIGGMIVEVEGRKVDTSLAARLKSLSATLLRRASQEIYSGRTYVTE
jgi:F-type H+-transporting ATPase subunit delta